MGVFRLVRGLGGWCRPAAAPIESLERLQAKGLLERWPGQELWRAPRSGMAPDAA